MNKPDRPLEGFPFSSRRVQVDGLDYAYVDEGAGPPVVMVHGNPTWSFHFRSLIAALPPSGHRAIAADHIGMGRSAKPAAAAYPHTLRRRIRDFAEFMQALDLTEPVTLVVHDWGGAIGLGWATEHPERVARLVLLNTAAFHPSPGKGLPLVLRAARAWPVGDLAVLRGNAFVRGATRLAVQHRMPAQVRRGYLAPYDSPAHRVAVLRFVKDIPLRPSDPAYPVLGRIEARLPLLGDRPVLICWGLRDFVFDRRILAQWERIYPHAQVLRLADAGHYVLEDAADRIVPRVLEFLSAGLPVPATGPAAPA